MFTGYTEAGEYVAYKAKRRELLEEVTDEEREVILASDAPPEEKISKIVCTIAKVKHVLQKLKDGELVVHGEGVGSDGRWDGTNAVIPTLIKAVQDDCWLESGETMRELQARFNVGGKRLNQALGDRVRSTFLERLYANHWPEISRGDSPCRWTEADMERRTDGPKLFDPSFRTSRFHFLRISRAAFFRGDNIPFEWLPCLCFHVIRRFRPQVRRAGRHACNLALT